MINTKDKLSCYIQEKTEDYSWKGQSESFQDLAMFCNLIRGEYTGICFTIVFWTVSMHSKPVFYMYNTLHKEKILTEKMEML